MVGSGMEDEEQRSSGGDRMDKIDCGVRKGRRRTRDVVGADARRERKK
jgi:hypothetical protein